MRGGWAPGSSKARRLARAAETAGVALFALAHDQDLGPDAPVRPRPAGTKRGRPVDRVFVRSSGSRIQGKASCAARARMRRTPRARRGVHREGLGTSSTSILSRRLAAHSATVAALAAEPSPGFFLAGPSGSSHSQVESARDHRTYFMGRRDDQQVTWASTASTPTRPIRAARRRSSSRLPRNLGTACRDTAWAAVGCTATWRPSRGDRDAVAPRRHARLSDDGLAGADHLTMLPTRAVTPSIVDEHWSRRILRKLREASAGGGRPVGRRRWVAYMRSRFTRPERHPARPAGSLPRVDSGVAR